MIKSKLLNEKMLGIYGRRYKKRLKNKDLLRNDHMKEKKLAHFVRDLFSTGEVIRVGDIYKNVLDNKSAFSSFPTDYEHRVRSALYQLKKNGEIVSVGKGEYKRA